MGFAPFSYNAIQYKYTEVDPLASDMLFSVFHQRVLDAYKVMHKIPDMKTLFVEGKKDNLIRQYNYVTMLVIDKNASPEVGCLSGVVYKFNAVDLEGNDNFYSFAFSIKEFKNSEEYDVLATILPFTISPYDDMRYGTPEPVKTDLVQMGDYLIPRDKDLQKRLYDEIVIKQLYKQDDFLKNLDRVHRKEQESLETL